MYSLRQPPYTARDKLESWKSGDKLEKLEAGGELDRGARRNKLENAGASWTLASWKKAAS